uniref:PLAT domain-containing protein n=1 Tax=Globodera pallida TaxID=36090 RepID=A0A183CPV3_GLOPA
MHGSNMDSEKLWLKQEFTDWLHSSDKGQRFRQNQSDSFAFRLPSRLGIINRITVGHERRGYGAGVFIDRILVTEDEVGGDGEEPMDDEHNANDCRQFLFLCNRWFDSGQVDGRLERGVRLSAFYMISSIPVDGRVTRGRWEFVLHGGTNDGRGGTTAQLAITGFGTDGQATTGGLYDTQMATAPSEALMQLDFGDIGELLKIRLEIDGAGSSPDYFLNFVEFKDLDTDERFVVMCGKWLRWRSAKKGDQPFRELLAFHIGVEPLPCTVEGQQQQQQQSTAAGAGVSLFAPKTSSSFEFEATSIGDIRSAQLEVLTVPENVPFLWECAEIVVTDFRGRSAPFYAFKFASPFTLQCSVQRADVLPFTDAL